MSGASTTMERDLLRLPVVGALLRRRGVQTSLRVALLALAVVMVLQGLFGSQLAPKNLATLLTWVHYRGLLVLALLLVGNLFCYACPIVLVRDLGRKIARPFLDWPRRLRNKWLAIVLFVGVLFAYELLDLWGDPWLTAWLVIGYFGVALLVDVVFRGASFCKFVCPVGQFNFLASTASPLEVKVKDPATCDTCVGNECLRGAPATPERPAKRGCELGLFLPKKVGNLDCTACLDCVHACPEQNVGVVTRTPGSELFDGRSRSGIGPLSARPDLAFLAAVFTFGALLNAFGMVSPVYALQQMMSAALGIRTEWPILGILFVVALVIEPIVLLGLAAWWTRRMLGRREGVRPIAMRYAFALVPLGFGVWLSHYCFHFLTGLLTVVPVVQSLVRDVAGTALLGAPDWSLGGMAEEAVYPTELGLLALGFVVSLAVTWRLAAADDPARPVRPFAPWAVVLSLLLGAAIWLLSQPMEMRGTFLGT